MHPDVRLQRGALVEALAAYRAHIGPLVRVNPDVVTQMRALGERPLALGTHVGPLAAVDALVISKMGRIVERLVALGARVGPLTRVDSLVVAQLRRRGEAFGAHVAHMWPRQQQVVFAGPMEVGVRELPPRTTSGRWEGCCRSCWWCCWWWAVVRSEGREDQFSVTDVKLSRHFLHVEKAKDEVDVERQR